MSQHRRKPVPHPKKWEDLQTRQLRLLCTGIGPTRHKPVVIDVVSMPLIGGRPDLGMMLFTKSGRDPTGMFPPCRRCRHPHSGLTGRSAIIDVLSGAGADVVSWDLGRRTLLQ